MPDRTDAPAGRRPADRADVAAVRRWLAERGVKACPVCRAEDLRVSKDLYVLVGLGSQGRAADLSRGSALARVRCATCAHVLLFHAGQMGL